MRVIWSPRALEQAEAAFGYIVAERPRVAEEWLEGLFERVKLLSDSPEQGRVVPEANRMNLRELIYGATHRVVYRADAERVVILLVHPSPVPMSEDELSDAE